MEDLANNRLDEIVDAYLLALERGHTPPSLDQLGEAERHEALGVIRLLGAAWNAATLVIPALEDDPVAAELGLVAPRAAAVALNGATIKVARMRQGRSIGDVSQRLTAEGHPASVRWIFDLEQGASTSVPVPVAGALARTLGVPLADLTIIVAPPKGDGLAAFFQSVRCAEIVREWAERLGLTADALRARVFPLLMAAPRRDRGAADEAEWARLLIALLKSGAL